MEYYQPNKKEIEETGDAFVFFLQNDYPIELGQPIAFRDVGVLALHILSDDELYTILIKIYNDMAEMIFTDEVHLLRTFIYMLVDHEIFVRLNGHKIHWIKSLTIHEFLEKRGLAQQSLDELQEEIEDGEG